MDPDLFLVIGILVGVFTIPALLAGAADGRLSRLAVLLVLVSASLIGVAVFNQPNGYPLTQIPDVFVDVIGRYVR